MHTFDRTQPPRPELGTLCVLPAVQSFTFEPREGHEIERLFNFFDLPGISHLKVGNIVKGSMRIGLFAGLARFGDNLVSLELRGFYSYTWDAAEITDLRRHTPAGSKSEGPHGRAYAPIRSPRS